MTIDSIVALESLGYTKREASFLYLVAAHSGYFLRRQFDYFIDRNRGSIVMRFLEKARIAGHLESLDYKQGWHVYHLCSRSIYRLAGKPDSQLRRRKGDAEVRSRLMALDYVLENENNHFLESAEDRIRFFSKDQFIPRACFTDDDGNLHALLASYPISLAEPDRPRQSLVRLAFIDEGMLTIEKFLRFLSATEQLLRSIGNFEVIYVAVSEVNLAGAKDAFWKRFYKILPTNSGLFEDNNNRLIIAHPDAPLRARFTTLLFRYPYPTLRRSEARGSERVRS
jgi:hypothetical protein